MCEKDTYPQIIHLTDRMDYLSAHINNHAVCLLVEKALEVEVPERVKYIRTIMDELAGSNRISYGGRVSGWTWADSPVSFTACATGK